MSKRPDQDKTRAELLNEISELRRYPSEPCDREGINLDTPQIEEIPHAKEEHLGVALIGARMAAWRWQVGSDEVTWSQDHLRALGHQFKPTYEDWRSRVHPEDIDRVEEELNRVLKNEDDFLCEYRILWPDRSVCWVEHRARVMLENGGEAKTFHGVIIDIDQRKKIEHTLKRDEDLYRNLCEMSPDAILVNLNNRIVYANQSAQRLLGSTNAEPILGRSPFDFIFPEYQSLVAARIQRLLNLNNDNPLVEQRWKRIDGSAVDVEVAASPVMWDHQRAVQVLLRDITERKQAEEALRESEERLNLALKAAGLGTWYWDVAEDRIVWDDQMCLLSGLEPGTIPQGYQGFLAILHEEDRPRVEQDVSQTFTMEAPYETRFRVRWPDGSLHYLHTRGKLYRDHAGNPQRLTGVSWDVTEKELAESRLREKEEHLYFLAHHDVLTSLPNRRLLQDRMQHALAKARRSGGQAALIYFDLDRFKTINDSLGHTIGDRVLKEIASRLARQVREVDTVARLGGDEFVVILEQVEEAEKVATLAQKLLLELTREIVVEGHRLYVTASAGISLFPTDSVDSEGLMKNAETAMYRAKERGKNTCQYFTPDMNARAWELLQLESGLRQALEHQQLVLHYQPQVDLTTGELIGVEALVRWEHPERGMVPPGDFIPLAEETGLIVPIGEWVLRTACAQSRAWRQAGFSPVRMAVNISPRQFRQSDLIARVDEILRETGLEPSALELEVTEGMIMNDVEAAIAIMEEFRKMGVLLAIDDFGTGYSSLGYLKRFPIAGLKIDRSFVRDLPGDANDAQIAASVIALAHNMNLRVVAEGIETADQLSFLRDKGCEHGQGYFFSPPCAAEELASRFLVA